MPSLASIVHICSAGTACECGLIVKSSSGLTARKSQKVLIIGASVIPGLVVDVLLVSSRYRIRRPLHDPLCVSLALDGEGLLCIADSESAAVPILILEGRRG